MRTPWLILLFAPAMLAVAQQPATDASSPAAEASPTPPRSAAQRPALDDLQPAVNVSDTAALAATRPRPASTPSRGTPGVVDTLDLGTTSITGNQELPKVLYIVPWKRSDLGDLVGRPVNTLLDEVLAPIDPEVFERHLDYYEALHGESEQE